MPRGRTAPATSGRRTQTRNAAPVAAPAPGEMPNIVNAGEAGPWVRQMLYSPPGWGKTSYIGSGGKQYRTLIVRSSLDLVPSRVIGSGVKEVICDTHEAMYNMLDYCRMVDPFPFDWVWWDCASIAQDVLLDDIWAGTIAAKPGRAYVLDASGRSTGQMNLTPTSGLDQGEYGRNMERIQQWVRHMVGCNRFHFGITAHPIEGQHPTNDEGGTLLRPYIQGKNMTEKFCGYMNMVGFLEVMDPDDPNSTRRLHFKENSRFYAKDHYDAFLPNGYIDNPTVPAVMTAIEKSRSGGGLAKPTTRRGAAGRRGQQPPQRRRGAVSG